MPLREQIGIGHASTSSEASSRGDGAADALQVARARVLGYLKPRAIVPIGDDALYIDDDLAERDPALAQLARAAFSGLAPAGPELRRRPIELALRSRPGVVINGPLSVAEHGFTLHAATRAGAQDDKGRRASERTCTPSNG